jgi:hypothetical protein
MLDVGCLFHQFKLNRTPQYDLPDLRGMQIFADPPVMRGTSGQIYTDNIVILQFKNLNNLCPSVSKKGNSHTI